MLNAETRFHIECAGWLDWALPPDAAWTTFPAGGGGEIRGYVLRQMGLKPGWPDIQIVYRGRYFGIELKAKKGTLQDSQVECHQLLIRCGVMPVAVVRTLDALKAALTAYGIPYLTEKPSTTRLKAAFAKALAEQ
jgi:hypothetical protein